MLATETGFLVPRASRLNKQAPARSTRSL